MASRLWFLVQISSRFAVNSLPSHILKPPFRSSYSVRRLLCAERKSDTLESTVSADAILQDESEGVTDEPPELPKKPKNFISKKAAMMKKDPDKLIWEGHRIRYRSGHPPKKTRLRCKRNSKKAVSGSPCVICSNDIEIRHEDIPLLKQFICPFTGKILDPVKTGVCRLQQRKLVAAIEKARDVGLLPFTVPRPDIRHL